MSITYKISMNGVSISDPYELLKAVFPQRVGEDAEGCSTHVLVTFDYPQTHVDLGPMVVVEVYNPDAPRLP